MTLIQKEVFESPNIIEKVLQSNKLPFAPIFQEGYTRVTIICRLVL